MRFSIRILSFALALGWTTAAAAQFDQSAPPVDPPSRVGRLSLTTGAVSLYPAGASDWTDASINYPLTTGDAVWADDDGRAEIHFGNSAIRIGARTSLVFGEVSDSVTQVRIDQGTLEVYLRRLNRGDAYEIDTPSGTVSLTQEGRYRIDVTPDGRRTTITTRAGEADVDVGEASRPIVAGRTATLLGGQRAPVIGAAIPGDSWEDWADARDQRDEASTAARYVPREMVGYEDLDDNGNWQRDQTYGDIWFPRNMPVGWAPYRYGHWASIDPWGWTWVDDASWGFAPFHYGRWASINGRWAWIPGTRDARVVYAPALVAFVGGPGWSVSATMGGRPAVGWVPLGPQEPFIPAYRTSAAYVQRVNVTSVRGAINVTQINVDNYRYVNRDIPGGITAVSRDDFTHARPIGRAAIDVRPNDVARARPSAVPIAGDERITPPPRGQAPPPRDTSARNGYRPAVRPVINGNSAPVPPPQWRGPSRRPDSALNNGRNGPPRNGPPPQQPPVQQPPVQQPPPRNQPPLPPPPPANQAPPSVRPVAPPPADRSAEREKALSAMRSRQQQEANDLAKRHAQLLKNPPAKMTPVEMDKLIDSERKALAAKHQGERDALEKQYGRPAG